MEKNENNKLNNNQKSLRELVYTYFCEQMKTGNLSAGKFIDQSAICKKLQISRAPLRDAIIQLETEGFVSILPRRGVIINPMVLKDIADFYEILACLESEAVHSAYNKIKEYHLKKMESINEKLYQALEEGKTEEYYKLNIEFHDIILDLTGNASFRNILSPIKQRLYDFPLKKYNIQWEKINLEEHARIIICLKNGNCEAAANIMKYEHWSFSRHEKYIKQFYKLSD